MITLEKIIVVDIETLKNCFILCARDYKTGAKKQYTLYQDEQYADEAQKLYIFLKNCVRNGYAFVTFNGLGFDMQVLHYFYDWCSDKQDPLYQFENQFIIEKLYEKAQAIISIQDNDDKFKYLVQEKDLFLPTVDIYKQLHYDRPAKRTSLKWVEFSMRYPTIQDMPIAHDEDINKEDVNTVLEYCWNDVDATYEFFNKVKFETELRLQLSENYKLNLVNASEPKMARDIFGKTLSKEMEISYMDLKKLKTIRKEVKFKNIIFPYIKFVTPELKNLLNDFNEVIIDCNPHSKQSFKYELKYNNLPIDLGLGGIHGCTDSGVYQLVDLKGTHPPSRKGYNTFDADEYEIIDLDVDLGVLTSLIAGTPTVKTEGNQQPSLNIQRKVQRLSKTQCCPLEVSRVHSNMWKSEGSLG